MEIDEYGSVGNNTGQVLTRNLSSLHHHRSGDENVAQLASHGDDDTFQGWKHSSGVAGTDDTSSGDTNKLGDWHPSSRVIRVSRASGGKDRHSKVWTSKGLRDRRVRLSVTTAIQFYDLQDRLGFDQPSKAVEWLINAAADAISELPSLNSSLLDPKDRSGHESDLKNPSCFPSRNHVSFSKASRSSSSEACSRTVPGPGLSLSGADVIVRSQEEKRESDRHHQISPISLSSTFTELLTGEVTRGSNGNTTPSIFIPSSSMDYFGSAELLGSSSSRENRHPHNFSQQMPLFNVFGENQQFPNMVSDHLIPVAATHQLQPSCNGDYNNLTFPISSGLTGYNSRGTLQSNSPSTTPSLVQHQPRYGSLDGLASVPFFIGAASTSSMENEHQHHQLQPGLHHFRSDGNGFSDHRKDKERN